MNATTEADLRAKVLTAWGRQPMPMVLAPRLQVGVFWLVENDEFLTASQGSYARFVVTPESPHRLRGWRGTLVIVSAARSMAASEWERWSQTLAEVTSMHGISTWTEHLP